MKNSSTESRLNLAIEVIKMLDDDELLELSQIIDERLERQPIIDIEPEDPSTSGESNQTDNLADLINSILTSQNVENDKSRQQRNQSSADDILTMASNLLNSYNPSNQSQGFNLSNLLGSNNLSGMLMQLLGNNQSSSLKSLLPSGLMGNFPKILKVGQEVLGDKSKEEQLLEAVIPFFPERNKDKLLKAGLFYKMFRIYKAFK